MRRASLVPLTFLGATLLALPAAGDDALGTLTVHGRTTILREVAAADQGAAEDSSDRWLVILASDRKVPEADRTIARLSQLAKEGKLHAVRILWHVGSDTVRAVPYDAALPQSGWMGAERPTIDLKRYGDGRVDAEFRSKMLGQDWHFHANVRTKVRAGGVVELEPEPEVAKAAKVGMEAAAPSDDPKHADKIALGKLGYEYTEEMLAHAVADGNLEAVRLFLKVGMSPNAREKEGRVPMLLAGAGCSDESPEKPRSAILELLTKAGGDVKAKDENGSTPLLWAVHTGCSPSAIRALLKAGADPNARAKGGATPLMLAKVLGRPEAVELLEKAGAKE